MKLSDYANFAEIIAAVAVVISLVYVGIQVNDSTRAVRSAAANDANVATQNWYLEVGANRQMSDILIRGLLGSEEFSTEDEFHFLMSLHGAFLAFQNSYLLAEEGALDESILHAVTTAILGVKDLPGFELYWRQRKDYLHVGFAAYVEELRTRPTIESVDIYRTAPRRTSAEKKDRN
ncbi:MAG: hypothetical protein R3323_06290 [Wenzhouxiangellaceae bacterium]|nr:hypothetical protein [Wenzhouxiangellaceae bacterium]